jgi:hypothetical protein
LIVFSRRIRYLAAMKSKTLSATQRKAALRLLKYRTPVAVIARELKCSYWTVYRLKLETKGEVHD